MKCIKCLALYLSDYETQEYDCMLEVAEPKRYKDGSIGCNKSLRNIYKEVQEIKDREIAMANKMYEDYMEDNKQ